MARVSSSLIPLPSYLGTSHSAIPVAVLPQEIRLHERSQHHKSIDMSVGMGSAARVSLLSDTDGNVGQGQGMCEIVGKGAGVVLAGTT